MDKIKKVIITLIIIVFVLILFIILLKKDTTNNEQEKQESNYGKTEINYGFTPIDDYETYYRVKAILNKYITYVRKINGDEQIEIGKLNMTEDEVKATLQKQGLEAIKKVLDEQYLDDMSVSDETIKLKQNKYKVNHENYNINIANIYEIDLEKNITIILIESKLNNEDLQMLVKLDKVNNTYSIFLDDYMEKYNYSKDMNKKDININKHNITENSYNSKIEVNVTETNIMSQYFVEYKRKMVNDTRVAYELLNEEYRQKKYGSYENFYNYIKSNAEKIMKSSIDKYQITENDGIKNYICIDKDGKYYIFIEKDITHYEVVLDTYTIDLPEFLEKYNNYSGDKKAGMNIQKIIDAINDGGYEYAYDKLDNTFKQNNFSNIESFKTYAEKNFLNKEIQYNKCEENGEIYIYEITITNNNQNIKKTFIIKLLEGSDFVYSFNVQ